MQGMKIKCRRIEMSLKQIMFCLLLFLTFNFFITSVNNAILQAPFGMSNPMSATLRNTSSAPTNQGMVYLSLPTDQATVALSTLRTYLKTNFNCNPVPYKQLALKALFGTTNPPGSFSVKQGRTYPYFLNFLGVSQFGINAYVGDPIPLKQGYEVNEVPTPEIKNASAILMTIFNNILHNSHPETKGVVSTQNIPSIYSIANRTNFDSKKNDWVIAIQRTDSKKIQINRLLLVSLVDKPANFNGLLLMGPYAIELQGMLFMPEGCLKQRIRCLTQEDSDRLYGQIWTKTKGNQTSF